MQTLQHNFKPVTKDISGIVGYSKALVQVFSYIIKATKYGEHECIEALPLVELIQNTNTELTNLMKEIEANLHTKEITSEQWKHGTLPPIIDQIIDKHFNIKTT